MPCTALNNDAACYFRHHLREAREAAVRDSEAFLAVIVAIENLGRYLRPSGRDMGQFALCIARLASNSPLALAAEPHLRSVFTPFETLYDLVRDARNDAMHQGAHARHLTSHAIALTIVLEDALAAVMNNTTLSDFMVPGPVCAHPWQPISLIRQQMLANSFTYLPIQFPGKQWHLISDFAVASFLHLRREPASTRMAALATSIEKAVMAGELIVQPAMTSSADTPLGDLDVLNGEPILVMRPGGNEELLGIVTAFDLL